METKLARNRNSEGKHLTRPAVYSEIKQKVPFDNRERELAVTLLRTGDVLRHALDRALAGHGVSPEQYNVLRILRGAGPSGLPTLDIADRMVSRSPNITRLIDKLEAKKLVRRERGTIDRRQAVVTITSGGLQELRRMDVEVDELMSGLRCLKKPETRMLVEMLDRVREHLSVETAKEVARRRSRSSGNLDR